MVTTWLPSDIGGESSTPVRVTICGAFQFTEVKIIVLTPTVTSLTSVERISIDTSAVGIEFNCTEKLAVSSLSLVKLSSGMTVIPARSLSAFVTLTVCDATPKKPAFEEGLIEAVIETV